MKNINKRRLLFCIIISFVINGTLFIKGYYDYSTLSENGIIKVLYIKSLTDNETTFIQKAKYTKVAKTYFVTDNGDSIFNTRKNIWAFQVEALEELNFYLPLDSVIYNKNKPNDYQLISEFRNYRIKYSLLSYLLYGPLFLSAWLYFMVSIFKKGLTDFRRK